MRPLCSVRLSGCGLLLGLCCSMDAQVDEEAEEEGEGRGRSWGEAGGWVGFSFSIMVVMCLKKTLLLSSLFLSAALHVCPVPVGF